MSLSINTNTSAMVALETLNATQTALSATENAVSTGKKVANASDSPAAFGIASQMNGNISGQSAVNDGLSFASSVVSSTNSAANQILSVLAEVQAAVTTIGNNQGSSTSLAQINTEINGYLKQIDTIAQNATTNGVNLLVSSSTKSLGITAASLTYVTGLQGSTAKIDNLFTAASVSGSTKTNTLSEMLGLAASDDGKGLASSNSFLTSTGGISMGSGSSFNLTKAITAVQDAITAMTNVTSTLGQNTKNIANMTTFGQTVSDNLTAGVGSLTDADMSAESAKLTSLQTKQSLAIKSLSIANGQSQNILSLFQ
ncbi:MAG: flagellin [Acetobacter okinawensis]|uniref:flagellin n=1 Tax=Acetobacter okinawensis TaxID=1076594 RepID=UPI0039E8C9DC